MEHGMGRNTRKKVSCHVREKSTTSTDARPKLGKVIKSKLDCLGQTKPRPLPQKGCSPQLCYHSSEICLETIRRRKIKERKKRREKGWGVSCAFNCEWHPVTHSLSSSHTPSTTRVQTFQEKEKNSTQQNRNRRKK